MKYNLAILINNMGRGGAQRVISRIVPELEKYYNVSLILLDSSKNIYNCECKIVSLGIGEEKNRLKYLVNLFKQGRKFEEYIENEEIHCVLSFLAVPNILNLAFNRQAKKIMSIRSSVTSDLNRGLVSKTKHKLECFYSKKADAAILPSEELKIDFIKEYHFNRQNAYVVYNPFNVQEIIEKSKQEDEKSSENVTIVAMGRLVKLKGFIFLIHSMSYVVAQFPQAKLVILGEGPERTILENEIKNRGLEKNICLYGDADNPFSVLSKAKLYVMTSLTEGFPNSVVEAMACSVPVICTSCKTGPKEILRKDFSDISVIDYFELSEYGILIPEFSEIEDDNTKVCKTLADAICFVLSNRDIQERYKKKSYERACEYSLEKSSHGFVSVIEKVIERK